MRRTGRRWADRLSTPTSLRARRWVDRLRTEIGEVVAEAIEMRRESEIERLQGEIRALQREIDRRRNKIDQLYVEGLRR